MTRPTKSACYVDNDDNIARTHRFTLSVHNAREGFKSRCSLANATKRYRCQGKCNAYTSEPSRRHAAGTPRARRPIRLQLHLRLEVTIRSAPEVRVVELRASARLGWTTTSSTPCTPERRSEEARKRQSRNVERRVFSVTLQLVPSTWAGLVSTRVEFATRSRSDRSHPQSTLGILGTLDSPSGHGQTRLLLQRRRPCPGDAPRGC